MGYDFYNMRCMFHNCVRLTNSIVYTFNKTRLARCCHFYNSPINGNEILITLLFPSKPFQIEILCCKIEEGIPFSPVNASFSRTLKMSYEGYLNINKSGDCVIKKLPKSKVCRRVWMTQTDGSSQSLDSEKEAQGKT